VLIEDFKNILKQSLNIIQRVVNWIKLIYDFKMKFYFLANKTPW